MDECTKAILELSQNPGPYSQYLSYSGKGLNELGDYNLCLKNSSSSYFMVNMYSPNMPPILSTFLGMCFLKTCAPEQIQYFIPLVAQQLNYSVENAYFYVRKSNGNEGDVTIDHSTYIIVFVLFLLLALGFTHPLISLFSKKSPKKKPEEKRIDIEENITVATKYDTITTSLLPDGPRTSKLMDFFKCFALDLNLKRIFSIREGPLDFFNGVRALSLLFVILGHDYYLRSGMSQNPAYLLEFITTPFYLIVGIAFLSVDVFFWLSGFFLAFVLLEPATKKYLKKPLTFIFAIFHRFCRIIPAYIVAIIIYWKVIVLTGSGPLWPILVDRTSDCKYLWRNILFIDNLFSIWGDNNYCFGWGWYLSNDFQLFILSLALIFIYAKHNLIGKISICLTIIATSLVGVWTCWDKGFKIFPFMINGYSVLDFMSDYYYKPWCRAPPYLFGLFLGVFYKEWINRKKECENNKDLKNTTFFAILKNHMLSTPVFKYSFYVIGLFIILFFSFFPRQIEQDPEAWSQSFMIFWLSFERLFFVIGLSFLFMNSLIISKDIIAKILSWGPFGVITNISFCGYLVHYFIIERSSLGSRQTIYYGFESVLYMYFTDILLTLFLAGCLSVFVEIPFINLEKFIKGDKRKPADLPKKEGTLIDEKQDN